MISGHFRLLNNISDNMLDQINIKHQVHLLKCNFEVLILNLIISIFSFLIGLLPVHYSLLAATVFLLHYNI